MRGPQAVGLAFAVSRTRLVTCAHVVNTAYGRDRRDASMPDRSPIWLEFPFGGDRDQVARLSSTITAWLPSQGSFDLHDVAVLAIKDVLPAGVDALPLASGNVTGPVQMWGPAKSGLGSAHVAGQLMGMTDKSRMQVDQELHGVFRVRPGFSGGPAWQPTTGRVVGILQASTVDDRATDTYVLSAELIQDAVPELALSRSGGTLAPHPRRSRRDVGILHLPNLCFDAENEEDRPNPEAILSDLTTNAEPHAGTPDLMVVSGNIAAHAWSEEYDAAEAFLTHLQHSLGLSTDRVIIVPGRSDVNDDMCKAYFLTSAGRRQKPQPPYWPKWENFADMYTRFYSREFPVDQPWLLSEVPELQLVVAGLNSTILQSHLETGGSVGMDQLRWFAERMLKVRGRQWLHIAAMYHSPLVSGMKQEHDGLLSDATDFAEILAPRLNLVLHGRPNSIGLGTVGKTAVPAVGPLAIAKNGCTYQVVRAGKTSVKAWQRQLDAMVANQRSTIRSFQTVHAAVIETGLSGPSHRPADARRRSEDPQVSGAVSDEPDRPLDADPELTSDHLLARVRVVCQMRLPQARTSVVTTPSGSSYLRVAVGHTAAAGRDIIAVDQYPLGVCEGSVTRADVERFIEETHSRYRASDSTVISKLVYDGTHADPELYRWSASHGIELMSFVEYQGGYDLRPYAKRQSEELASDPDYAPNIYVPQRYREVELFGGMSTDAADQPDLLHRLMHWLSDPQGHLVVILGAFGHGKTFLLRQLAREMYRLDSPAIPVLVQLRDLEKTHSLNELVAAQLARGGERRIELDTFRYLLKEGRIALLFDGFEELAVRVTYDRAVEHLATIVQAAEGRAKVVLAGRDQYFRTDADVASALSDRLASIAGRRLVKLLDFDIEQIEQFLAKRLGRRQAGERLTLLRDVHELLGLAANPRMLDFITRIDEQRLRLAQVEHSEITAAGLYKEIVTQWLTLEAERLNHDGSPSRFSAENLLRAVVKLALRLWESGEPSLGEEDLSELGETLVAIAPAAGRLEQAVGQDRNVASQLVGSHTMLVRDAGGRFTFVHRSVMEWLVARSVADDLSTGSATSAALGRPISPLMADFIGKLAPPGVAAAWSASVLADPDSFTVSSENALLIQRGLPIDTASVQLAGRDLRGQDLSARRLVGADLSGADLSEAQLVQSDLSGANLSHARLVRAKADGVLLNSANLRAADLTGARLAGCDLTDANLDGTILRRATLLNAVTTSETFARADTHGAALPGSDKPVPQIRSRLSQILTLSVDPNSALLASAGSNHVISLWDLQTGTPIRTLTGHHDWVWAMAFSPDGRWLASAGGDRTIRLWDAGNGEPRHRLRDRAGALRAVAFAPDSTRLAAAGDDRAIRIWDSHKGTVLQTLKGHRQPVWAVAFSGDGNLLVSGGSDNVIRIWDLANGKTVRTLIGHTAALRSIAFSPDGKTLASAGGDSEVRIWDVSTGDLLMQLVGHKDWVRSVAFSPDGRRLASAGGDRIIRIWDLTDKSCTLEIPGHTDWIRAVVYAPDGRTVISAGDDRVIRVWDGSTGTSVRETTGGSSAIRSVAFSTDGSSLVSAGDDPALHIWDARLGKSTHQLAAGTGVHRSVAYSPDGKLLASAGSDRIVRIHRTRDLQLIHELTGHANRIRTLAFAPDSNTVASAGDDRTVRLWRLNADPPVSEDLPHSDPVWSVAYSANGLWLASAGSDPVVRIWQVMNDAGAPSQRGLTGHRGVLRALAFAPDDKLLASAGSDRTVRLWNPDNGAQLADLTGHKDEIWSVAFSPNGEHLASCGDDRTVRIWNVRDRQQILQMDGHKDCVWSVAYSPDGRWLASSSDDGTIRLWDAHTGEAKCTLLTLTDNGWAALVGKGHYKLRGTPTGEFWYAMNMCRFEAGDLQSLGVGLHRLEVDAPILE
jgi:WD40 repeat protein/3',5'-cyclic AMP phosphodiesterase CpdA/type II secretory pathway predicted ATPase ExeA